MLLSIHNCIPYRIRKNSTTLPYLKCFCKPRHVLFTWKLSPTTLNGVCIQVNAQSHFLTSLSLQLPVNLLFLPLPQSISEKQEVNSFLIGEALKHSGVDMGKWMRERQFAVQNLSAFKSGDTRQVHFLSWSCQMFWCLLVPRGGVLSLGKRNFSWVQGQVRIQPSAKYPNCLEILYE